MTLSTVQFSISLYSYLLKGMEGRCGWGEGSALAALPEAIVESPVLTTQWLTTVCNSSYRDSKVLFWSLWAPGTQSYTKIDMQAKHSYIQNTFLIKKITKSCYNSRIAARKILRSVQTILLFYKIRNDPKIMRTCQNKQWVKPNSYHWPKLIENNLCD